MGYENRCIVVYRCIFFVKIQLKVGFLYIRKKNTTLLFFFDRDVVFSHTRTNIYSQNAPPCGEINAIDP